MTAAELVEAIRNARVPANEGEGVTIRDLLDGGLRLSEKAIRDRLRELLATGRARVSRRLYIGLDGRRAQVPSYVLVEPAPVKRGRAKAA
jgi:hypothetical protein